VDGVMVAAVLMVVMMMMMIQFSFCAVPEWPRPSQGPVDRLQNNMDA
jgi:hypothetical protein